MIRLTTMAAPNVSAISLNHCLSFSFLQFPTFHRSKNGNSSDPCNLSWVRRRFRGHPSSLSGQYSAKTGGPIHHHQNSYPRSCMPCQVKSEDSEGTLSSEGIILDEQALERALQLAIEEENYAQAAKIRDSLRFLHEDNKASVLAANARFYNLFRKGDLAGMQALWLKGDSVCCVHPGVGGICGYDLVMGSWEFVMADYEFPLEIEVKNVEVHVRGDVGYVTCTEVVKTKGSSWGKQFATNVFEKIDGQWFICIHHASYIDL